MFSAEGSVFVYSLLLFRAEPITENKVFILKYTLRVYVVDTYGQSSPSQEEVPPEKRNKKLFSVVPSSCLVSRSIFR